MGCGLKNRLSGDAGFGRRVMRRLAPETPGPGPGPRERSGSALPRWARRGSAPRGTGVLSGLGPPRVRRGGPGRRSIGGRSCSSLPPTTWSSWAGPSSWSPTGYRSRAYWGHPCSRSGPPWTSPRSPEGSGGCNRRGAPLSPIGASRKARRRDAGSVRGAAGPPRGRLRSAPGAGEYRCGSVRPRAPRPGRHLSAPTGRTPRSPRSQRPTRTPGRLRPASSRGRERLCGPGRAFSPRAGRAGSADGRWIPATWPGCSRRPASSCS